MWSLGYNFLAHHYLFGLETCGHRHHASHLVLPCFIACNPLLVSLHRSSASIASQPLTSICKLSSLKITKLQLASCPMLPMPPNHSVRRFQCINKCIPTPNFGIKHHAENSKRILLPPLTIAGVQPESWPPLPMSPHRILPENCTLPQRRWHTLPNTYENQGFAPCGVSYQSLKQTRYALKTKM